METETLQEIAAVDAPRARYASNYALAAQLRPNVPGTFAYEALRNRASAEGARIRASYVPVAAQSAVPLEVEVLV